MKRCNLMSCVHHAEQCAETLRLLGLGLGPAAPRGPHIFVHNLCFAQIIIYFNPSLAEIHQDYHTGVSFNTCFAHSA